MSATTIEPSYCPLNLVVLWGVLSSPPQARELPSGSVVTTFQVTVRSDDGPADTVAVSWWDPPARADALEAGTEVVVAGRLRRRFYRAGAVTQSRTEVVAEAVIPARRRKQARAAIARAQERLAAALG